jgi:hypothetical protein
MYHWQLTERGDLRSFETRVLVEFDAPSLADVFLQMARELVRIERQKADDARVVAGVAAKEIDGDLPF